MYTSLHNHTDYSNIKLIDSMNPVDKLIDRAFSLGLKGVAITDHETLSAHVKALKHYDKNYKDKDFKLILGNEIYITREGLNAENHEKGEKFYHMVLLAKNNAGHKQLRELSSRAWTRSYMKNMMRTPTYFSDLKEVIGKDSNINLVATTACLGGVPGFLFQTGQHERISGFLSQMVSLFGYDNFYIEIQPSAQTDQILFNKYMVENYWNDYKFVFTTDSHYLKAEDKKLHKWFLQSQSGDREVDEYYSSTYLMDYKEVKEFFSYLPEEKIECMKDNTNYILSMIEDYDLKHGQVVPKIQYDFEQFEHDEISEIMVLFDDIVREDNYPYLHYFMNTEDEADMYLMYLIYKGYYDKIFNNERSFSAVSFEERIERLNYELQQVREISLTIKQSLADYFITMAKMIEITWNEADSIVGPGRGSASGFLTNYLLGITQVDPQMQALYMPPWRFMHMDRPELPDIDIDTESTKRVKIFNKIKSYFNSIGSDVVSVCTFGTEGSKSSIRTAGRGLQVDDSVVSYLTSMIPNERGFDLTLSQCYYGDDDHKPILQFKEEMDANPDFRDLAFAIEGLVVRLGIHAAGIIVVGGEAHEFNSVLKSKNGAMLSAYSLEDSEYMGGLKYDMLTVAALDKIHATMNYMLEDGVIEWQGSLRSTYEKYLLPANLEYDELEMWKLLWEGEVIDAFQFDTAVGSQAVKQIKPRSVAELAVANSIMRLMAQEGMELPLDTFVRYKNDIDLWYKEMLLYGLDSPEIEILEPHLKILYGVADSQESVMLLTMDEKIVGFTLSQANLLRKAIAKKDFATLEKTRAVYYQRGEELGTNRFLLDYVWNVQIGRQIGYSFSILHTMAYSLIALQQMNLAYRFPIIYWKTACLSVNAGAINEEDYHMLVEEGIIELSEEEDKRSQNKIQYGKVATAISDMRGKIKVNLPDINLSRMGFTPNAQDSTILYGIKGITRVGEAVIQAILENRPYSSLENFLEKMIDYDGKKLISKDRVVNLIKAGTFDKIENMPREEILRKYIKIVADQKNKLTLSNLPMLLKKGLVPERFSEEVKCSNFTKYIRKTKIRSEWYILDEVALTYFLERFPAERLHRVDGHNVIPIKWWDPLYSLFMDPVRQWLKDNNELLQALNTELFNEEYEKYAKGTLLDWELQALNFYHSGHPLEKVSLPIETQDLDDIVEGVVERHIFIENKRIPIMKLSTIAGTVIDKDKVKGIVTLSTTKGVIDVKFYKALYSKFIHESDLDEEDENYKPNEENFFEKGTHLIITGMKRGNAFIPKRYKNTPTLMVYKIILDENGNYSKLISKEV